MKKGIFKDNQSFKFDSSMIILIISNLIPIYGVLFWNWNIFNILILYWLESGIIGFFTIFKIMLSNGDLNYKNDKPIKLNLTLKIFLKLILIPFFIIHYSIFMLVHLMFIYFISTLTKSPIQPFYLAMILLLYSIIFLISHGLSFINNFIIKKEYEKISPNVAMASPYLRIIVMHLTILLGTFLFVIIGIPRIGSTLIIILKTLLDLFFHYKEHQKMNISKPLKI
ncbi:MAG: DUF6498-containing protein [Candidatus Pacearchaeota archaeon]|jgi:hypothetical protein